MSVSDDEDISSHIIDIGTVGAQLQKLCRNGIFSINNIKTASLVASLPKTFTAVTSPFKQCEDVSLSEVCVAVEGHVVTWKNRANQSVAATSFSSANMAKSNQDSAKTAQDASLGSQRNSNNRRKQQNNDSGHPGPCTNCKGRYHNVSAFLQKKNKDLSKKLDDAINCLSSGKANQALDLDSDRDFTDSTARLATALNTHSSNSSI